MLPIVHEPLRLEGSFITWLGHASFLIKLGSTVLITDPVLGTLPMIKRWAPVPYTLEELPRIDFVLLSHDHRDHCDEQSLKQIAGRFKPQMLVPLNMQDLLSGWVPDITIQEAGWYQQYSLDRSGLEVFFLPARHWGKRGLLDDHRRLWGSFLIRYKQITIYFGGDSGYDAHFKEIASLFGKIDIALLPIGAYKPSWMMKEVHMSPPEAHLAFEDLKASLLVPMHYGVFDLADEPMGEPISWLRKIMQQHAASERLKELAVGEAWTI